MTFKKKYQAMILALAVMAVAAALSWWWPFDATRLLPAGAAVVLLFLSFVSGYVDSSLGMGYGLTLTPILIILGHHPLEVVPAVLASQLAHGVVAAVAHHKVGNVDFRPGGRAFRITAALAASSVIGTVGAVLIALSLSERVLAAWIGIVVFAIGVVTLASFGRHIRFSWPKILTLGVFAGFNKGMTGGGYGPVITGGQLLFGVEAPNAIAITTLAETFACVAGSLMFLAGGGDVGWSLTPFLTVGAVAAVPFSALTVRVLKPLQLKISVGVLTAALGILLLLRLFVY